MAADIVPVRMSMDPVLGRTPLIVDAVAGGAVFSGFALPWVNDGQGETLRGLDFADQLISGPIVPDWGAIAGGAVYTTVLLGAVLVLVSPLRNVPVRRSRLIICGAFLTMYLVVGVAGWFPFGMWGPAPIAAVIGLVASVVANGIEEHRTLGSAVR